jgi:hypothetical protein
MLDDENDKRIKEAAEHYHPAYDDTAWEKMQQLLNEHLPQKKERKRIFFILPSLLLVAVLVWFIMMENGKNSSSNVAQNSPSTNIPAKSLGEKPAQETKEKVSTSSSVSTKNLSLTEENKTADNKHSHTIISQKNVNSVAAIYSDKKEIPPFNNNVEEEKSSSAQLVAKANNDNENKTTSSVQSNSESTNKNDSVTAAQIENNSTRKTITNENVPLKNEKEKTIAAIKKSKETNGGFKNNFGVSISAGPDISGVQANKIGKLTVVFGAGLNYSISKNFSVRSGFYISKKIYSVEGNDYDLPGGNPNYAYLENVNANCLVYEIPLKLDYNFKKLKNHNWFISTGISSYLMKKENYDYYYKTVSGETYDKDWTIKNKNQHFFSVLTFSGGYQYSFNKQFSFAAEPYVNLPLKGIGVGKVKLNSGGILFTLKAKPFLKKEK